MGRIAVSSTVQFRDDQTMRFAQKVSAVAEEAVRQACEEGAVIARGLAPIGKVEPGNKKMPGRLKASIKTRMVAGGGQIYSDAPHAMAIEKGARPHTITGNPFLRFPKRTGVTKAAVQGKNAGMVVARSVSHPGNSSQPFLRPAYEAVKHRVLPLMKAML